MWPLRGLHRSRFPLGRWVGLRPRGEPLRAERVAERRWRAEVAGGTMLPGSGVDEPSVRIESLSKDERLDLLERLWDSLSETPADVPVTLAQQAELDRRSDALDRDLAKGRALRPRRRVPRCRSGEPRVHLLLALADLAVERGPHHATDYGAAIPIASPRRTSGSRGRLRGCGVTGVAGRRCSTTWRGSSK